MTLKKHLATLLLASALVSVSCAAKSPKQDTVSPDQSIAPLSANGGCLFPGGFGGGDGLIG